MHLTAILMAAVATSLVRAAATDCINNEELNLCISSAKRAGILCDDSPCACSAMGVFTDCFTGYCTGSEYATAYSTVGGVLGTLTCLASTTSAGTPNQSSNGVSNESTQTKSENLPSPTTASGDKSASDTQSTITPAPTAAKSSSSNNNESQTTTSTSGNGMLLVPGGALLGCFISALLLL